MKAVVQEVVSDHLLKSASAHVPDILSTADTALQRCEYSHGPLLLDADRGSSLSATSAHLSPLVGEFRVRGKTERTLTASKNLK